ncbi:MULTISPECIES: hypothetical protein [Lactobacillus]|uniref:Fibronectin type-III domain-containing protein n=1 Tax=Lactobacillus xujianguonis TaxID=2495899 RepID=A0A437SXE3_9LACO|nr:MULTISPECIES: hypothetical protein [Lactobacillus]RVU71594.1 hypothetical protein EJK17_01055 [Lactobacillus xujianguonis]RVU77754.1 hypothetical protein EJK20_00655 [Lactobacillus xujianguonis]
MNAKNILLGLTATAAFLGFSANQAQAATKSLPTKGSHYIQKGNTYKLHLKVPGKVTLNTKAKYTITNSQNWKCIPYRNSSKSSHSFYLRAGNYNLTTTSKKSQVKTSFTSLSKLKKSLDTFPISKTEDPAQNPPQVKMGQAVNGFLDLFKTYPYGKTHVYQFTLTQPQKVDLTFSSMPIYDVSQGATTTINLTPVTDYDYKLDEFTVNDHATNKKHAWTLTKGTYKMTVTGLRGRFNFKMTSKIINGALAPTSITGLTPTSKGLKISYGKADKATGYEIYVKDLHSKNLGETEPVGINQDKGSYPKTLSQVIPSKFLINGNTYEIAVRSVNTNDGPTFSGVSAPIKYTYYLPSSKRKIKLKKPSLKVSCLIDPSQNTPYINLTWKKAKSVNSYEVAYRVKGSKSWHTFFTKNKTSEKITSPTDPNSPFYFVQGKSFEVRIRALHSDQKSAWSKVHKVNTNCSIEDKTKLITIYTN